MGHLLHARNGHRGGFHFATTAFQLIGFGYVVSFELEIGMVTGDFVGVGDAAEFVLWREPGHRDHTFAERLQSIWRKVRG